MFFSCGPFWPFFVLPPLKSMLLDVSLLYPLTISDQLVQFASKIWNSKMKFSCACAFALRWLCTWPTREFAKKFWNHVSWSTWNSQSVVVAPLRVQCEKSARHLPESALVFDLGCHTVQLVSRISIVVATLGPLAAFIIPTPCKIAARPVSHSLTPPWERGPICDQVSDITYLGFSDALAMCMHCNWVPS